MLEQAETLGQRFVAGVVFRAVGNVIPDQFVGRLLIDADHAIAGVLQKVDNFPPTSLGRYY
jgi:hypothetical protein